MVDVDDRKLTRLRFVAYVVLCGPLLGLGLCLVLLIPFGLYERFFGLGQHRDIAFLPVKLAFQWFFPLGFGPALIAALYAMIQFTKKKELFVADVLVAASFGAVVGNLGAVVIAFQYVLGERSDVVSLPVLIFLIALPLVLSPICSLLLWQFRPRRWIGPLTKDEFESEQHARSS